MSASQYPGLVTSQWSVRTGICSLSRLPGLIPRYPLGESLKALPAVGKPKRHRRRQGLPSHLLSRRLRWMTLSGSKTSSPCRDSLPLARSCGFSAALPPKSLITCFQEYPHSSRNPSRIHPLPFRPGRTYRSRILPINSCATSSLIFMTFLVLSVMSYDSTTLPGPFLSPSVRCQKCMNPFKLAPGQRKDIAIFV